MEPKAGIEEVIGVLEIKGVGKQPCPAQEGRPDQPADNARSPRAVADEQLQREADEAEVEACCKNWRVGYGEDAPYSFAAKAGPHFPVTEPVRSRKRIDLPRADAKGRVVEQDAARQDPGGGQGSRVKGETSVQQDHGELGV